MPKFEYLLLCFERSAKSEFICDGDTFTGDDLESARRHFRSQWLADSGARLRDHRRRFTERRAANDRAFRDWTKRREALRDRYRVESVEVEIRKGRYVKRDRVTAPDGSVRTVDAGSGREHVDAAVQSQVGEPPADPGVAPDLSDDAILEVLLTEMQTRRVDTWSAFVEPSGPGVAHGEWVGVLEAALAEELNRLGAEGWRVVDVSEDRALTSGVAGTATTVVAARYTLMRERGG